MTHFLGPETRTGHLPKPSDNASSWVSARSQNKGCSERRSPSCVQGPARRSRTQGVGTIKGHYGPLQDKMADRLLMAHVACFLLELAEVKSSHSFAPWAFWDRMPPSGLRTCPLFVSFEVLVLCLIFVILLSTIRVFSSSFFIYVFLILRRISSLLRLPVFLFLSILTFSTLCPLYFFLYLSVFLFLSFYSSHFSGLKELFETCVSTKLPFFQLSFVLWFGIH